MIIVHTVAELQNELDPARKNGAKIGFVPTMGALHQGHISLVEKCLEDNGVCVVSIFVNPTQFNDKSDFQKYPRTLDADFKLLEEKGVDILFAPGEKDIYPQPDTRQFDFGLLDKVMEGKHRPGHFNGVAQVVSRFFDIVKPDRAYFGEKDFQQLAIIRAMVKDLDLSIQIIGMPIRREESGLAMSSRNERLTPGERKIAANIYAILSDNYKQMNCWPVADTIKKVTDEINKEPGLRVEYFDIVNGNTLQSVSDWSDSDYIVGCIAVFCGDVRLIDNITYRTPFN